MVNSDAAKQANLAILTDFNQKGSRVTNLKLITGGRDGDGSDMNWLQGLEIGTIFLVKEKRTPQATLPSFMLLCYCLVFKTDKACKLASENTQLGDVYVDPIRFCERYDLFEVIGKVPMEQPQAEEQEEENNGGTDWTERDSGGAASQLENHDDAQRSD